MENSQPPHKKEIKKAWLFTIILHLFIAGVLITYWYFNQSKKPDPVTTNLQSTAVTPPPATQITSLPPLKTEVASISTPTTATQTTTPASTSTATANNTPTPTSVATTTETQKPKTPTNKERPLSKYINAQTPNTTTPSATTNITVTTTKTVVETPATTNNKQKLTARDIPRNEMLQTNNKPTKTKAEQQELMQLNKEVEQDNDKISKLIEQVKNQNQRKINENVAKNMAGVEKPQTTTPPKSETNEKIEKQADPNPNTEKTQPTNDPTQSP